MPFEKPPISDVARQLGLECDAPPHEIVKACAELGFSAPEDARWDMVRPNTFAVLCRHRDPHPSADIDLRLEAYTAGSGQRHLIRLGQCPLCHRVYWRAALANEKDAA